MRSTIQVYKSSGDAAVQAPSYSSKGRKPQHHQVLTGGPLSKALNLLYSIMADPIQSVTPTS